MSYYPWSRILSFIQKLSPMIASTVNPPANLETIQILEESVNLILPEPFCDYLLTFEGQNEAGELHPLLGSNRFLPVAEIIRVWQDQKNLGDFLSSEYLGRENKIRTDYQWNPRWLPFASLDGQMLLMDFDPGKNGTYGQVFQYWPGMDFLADDFVLANSFADFGSELLRRFESDDYHYHIKDQLISFDDDWMI